MKGIQSKWDNEKKTGTYQRPVHHREMTITHKAMKEIEELKHNEAEKYANSFDSEYQDKAYIDFIIGFDIAYSLAEQSRQKKYDMLFNAFEELSAEYLDPSAITLVRLEKRRFVTELRTKAGLTDEG